MIYLFVFSVFFEGGCMRDAKASAWRGFVQLFKLIQACATLYVMLPALPRLSCMHMIELEYLHKVLAARTSTRGYLFRPTLFSIF